MMRGLTISFALLGLAFAAPADQRATELETRQSFQIGPGSGVVLEPSNPGGNCDQDIFEKTGFCIISGKINPRQTFTLPNDKGANLREAIKEAQLEIQRLEAKKSLTEDEKKQLEALKYFVKKTSGVISISPVDGGSTVLVPGRMARRQSSGSPCLVDLEKYQRELMAFLLSFPPRERAQIWKELIQNVCNIQTGPITPDPTIPGGPIKPDQPAPSTTLKPSD
ncbi:hypothetical protein MCOR25_002847 [Pyricularia grisea]|uniref:Uncharacterized protein n=1 Tax=Pyricularia grisea TaxID=148305 RepID=A0A6P8BFI6_PYRGI|nr:uncharacterized protein PgNI_01222 [Pyricularia grisea]KAI6376032.1 hypothetical protein MCOR25_002847 [Pyricularia grisea]TLD15558.1 hypothetical protein PgNI_01222 [Pyricularia grisea]